MKAQIIPYPPPPREVVVTMSENEACDLYAALGPLGSLITSRLLRTLHDVGIRA